MSTPVDVLDTQILVYGATESEQWAVDILEELLCGDRVAYIPRYVLAEFARVMRTEFVEPARFVIESLGRSDTVAAAHIRQVADIDIPTTRNTATARTLARVCDMEPKDAPVLAAAANLSEFLTTVNTDHSNVRLAEAYVLLNILDRAGVNPDQVYPRLLTNEQPFVGRPLSDLRLGRLTIKHVP
ncbi:hypothetical protein RYH80_10585 [Halobaculum sp. MBLA0147]|uniref:hypothetical protein n=1 Tax=Halobaculum sp. MBLA0147 TaxID=3079934 RepID=UPI003524D923